MGFFEGSFLRLVLVFKFSCFLLKYWALIRSGKGIVTVMALWNFLLLGSIVTIGLTAPPWTMISSTVSSSIGCTLMPTLTRLTSDLKLKRQRFSDWLLRLDENLKSSRSKSELFMFYSISFKVRNSPTRLSNITFALESHISCSIRTRKTPLGSVLWGTQFDAMSQCSKNRVKSHPMKLRICF